MEVVHEHGFYDDSNKNIGYSKKGIMNRENQKDYKMEDTLYDDVLMNKAIENVKKSGRFDEKGKNYKLTGNNCQDFADAMREEYNNLYNKLDDKAKKEVDARVEQLKQKIQQEEKNR